MEKLENNCNCTRDEEEGEGEETDQNKQIKEDTPELDKEQEQQELDKEQPVHTQPDSFSLWDHLKFQINPELDQQAQQHTHSNSLKAERISNFLHVPISVEKFIGFGFFVCLDSFLSVFTILPIKFFVATLQLCATLPQKFLHLILPSKPFSYLFLKKKKIKQELDDDQENDNGIHPKRLSISSKIDLIQGLLIILVCVFLHHVTDASRMYHSVRGQDTIKLYVIFNVLEVADRLCCSFGQDILDSLFSPSTLGRRIDGTQPHIKPIFLFTLAFIFTVAHTLVLFYQLVSLNVAINSFDDSLMTLLISNQFVEIKGSVFKKFEKENLFQMGCADIVERFQLFLMLTIIAVRNLIEVSGSSTLTGAGGGNQQPSYTHQYLPASFNLTPSISLVEKTFSPVVVVMLSEVLVDWLKHAFITKFNHIRPAVYGRFIDLLCKDLVGVDQVDQSGRTDQEIKPFVDRSPVVSRRLGFSVFPMFCLTVRVLFQAIDMLSDTSEEDFKTILYKKSTTNNYNKTMIQEAKFSIFEFIKRQFNIIYFSIFSNQSEYMKQIDPNLNSSFDPNLSSSSSPSSSSSSSFEFQVPDQTEGSSKFSNFQINGFIILSVIIVMMFLILIKLYLGIRIRSFAMRRVESLNERILEDELNGRDRVPIGVTKSEIKRDEVDRNLIERAEFELPQREYHHSSSSPSPSPYNSILPKKLYLHHLPSPSSDLLPNSNYHQSIDQKTPTQLLSSSSHYLNSPFLSSDSVLPPTSTSSTSSMLPPLKSDRKKNLSMDELSRFDMVRSRIW